MENIKIYCIYHNNQILKDYNLSNLPSYYQLLNLSDYNIEGDNINYLNPYLCEICAYYYIWKNQIYSPYVGFCHYRRLYKDLGYYNLQKYGVHYYGRVKVNINKYKEKTTPCKYSLDKLYHYLLTKFNKSIVDKYFINNEIINCPFAFSYILNWKDFNNICELCFGCLEYIYPNYKNKDYISKLDRTIVWDMELCWGIIIALYFNNIFIYNTTWEIQYNYVLLLKSNDEEEILKWAKKNNRSTIKCYVLSDKLDKQLFWYHTYIHIVKDISEIKENIIKLNSNEYINIYDPCEVKHIHFKDIEKYKEVI